MRDSHSHRRSVTWLGHATVCVEARGARLLTDPLLRGRFAHLTRRAPLIRPEELEPLDAVLISHVHRDHLDLPTLRRLRTRVMVVPRGCGRHLGDRAGVHELAVGEEVAVGATTVRAVPAVHEAARGGAKSQSLGFVIDDDLYFAGDTDLFDGMDALAPLEVALLPVWGWGPSLGHGHMDPDRAALALGRLRPRLAVPIHWGTYFPALLGRRGHPKLSGPPRRFAQRASEIAPAVDVRVLDSGQTLELDGDDE